MTLFAIITGGPCAGKTTTINHLASLGKHVLPEAATDVIKKMKGEGIAHPYLDKKFEFKVVELQKELMKKAAAEVSHALTDRSPLDALWYFKKLKPEEPCEPLESEVLPLKDNFFKTVFVLEHLDFCEDNGVRHESSNEAKEIESGLTRFYKEHGFEVVLIEKKSVEERSRDIFSVLNSRGFF